MGSRRVGGTGSRLLSPSSTLVALGLLGCGNGEHTAGVTSRTTAQAEASKCAPCHAEIVEEWEASQHSQSDDAIFRAALAGEAPRAFCQRCHAPSDVTGVTPATGATATTAASGATAAIAAPSRAHGIRCGNCHPGIEPGRFGHEHPKTQASAVARETSLCARCHEFDFPGERRRPEKMQLTVTEHAASSFASVSCAECHMPSVPELFGSHRSHAFAEARDPATLRAALEVRAERPSGATASFTLRSRQVGHAFPTGDLFRRLVVEVEALGPDYAVVARGQRELARHFGALPGPERPQDRIAIGDDRVFADAPRRVDFELGEAARGRPLAWRVRYERVLSMNPAHEAQASVESSVLLASGELPDQP